MTLREQMNAGTVGTVSGGVTLEEKKLRQQLEKDPEKQRDFLLALLRGSINSKREARRRYDPDGERAFLETLRRVKAYNEKNGPEHEIISLEYYRWNPEKLRNLSRWIEAAK